MFLDIKDVEKGMYVNGQRHQQPWKRTKRSKYRLPPFEASASYMKATNTYN